MHFCCVPFLVLESTDRAPSGLVFSAKDLRCFLRLLIAPHTVSVTVGANYGLLALPGSPGLRCRPLGKPCALALQSSMASRGTAAVPLFAPISLGKARQPTNKGLSDRVTKKPPAAGLTGGDPQK